MRNHTIIIIQLFTEFTNANIGFYDRYKIVCVDPRSWLGS